MIVRRWNVADDGPVTEAAVRHRLEALGYTVSRYTYGPGTRFPDHTHGVDKIDAVLAGQFRLTIGREEALLGPGDWIEVPRGAVHSATVVGHDPVISLDAVRSR